MFNKENGDIQCTVKVRNIHVNIHVLVYIHTHIILYNIIIHTYIMYIQTYYSMKIQYTCIIIYIYIYITHVHTNICYESKEYTHKL